MPFSATAVVENLINRLQTERGLAETTARQYVRYLVLLNDGKLFRSLSFLKDVDAINAKLAEKSLAVRRTHYAACAAALSLSGGAPFVKLCGRYKKMMGDNAAEIAAAAPPEGTLTEKEKKKWMDWEDILKKRDEFGAAMTSARDYSAYMVLCLYTMIAPRRNTDFKMMKVVMYSDSKPVNVPELDATYNYYDRPKRLFVFNNFKTRKHFGQQILPVPEELDRVICRTYPCFAEPVGATPPPMRFLLHPASDKPVQEGYILKCISKILKQNIGSSMLRHSFITHLFGAEMEKSKTVAGAMAHSTATQRAYLRNAMGGVGGAGGDGSSVDSSGGDSS